MEEKMQIKLYLAGPRVFLPNALARAEEERRLCREYGFTALHPADNNLNLNGPEEEVALRIYQGDIAQVRASHIIVANCNPFRGFCVDDGTAYELGYANALGKPSYGYIEDLTRLDTRLKKLYASNSIDLASKRPLDKEGFVITNSFGTSINLMMECGMWHHGGRLIQGWLEDCLRAIRQDLNEDRLRFS